jgi:hypothetical protein
LLRWHSFTALFFVVFVYVNVFVAVVLVLFSTILSFVDEQISVLT